MRVCRLHADLVQVEDLVFVLGSDVGVGHGVEQQLGDPGTLRPRQRRGDVQRVQAALLQNVGRETRETSLLLGSFVEERGED